MSEAQSKQSTAFKDWFDEAAARALAAQVQAVYEEFDEDAFVEQAVQGLFELELLARVKHFANALAVHLPEDIPQALAILVKSLPAPLLDCEEVSQGVLQWPIGQFIGDYGLGHWQESWAAMTALTQRFSAEFAVRPFVEQDPDRAVAEMLALVKHKNPHVRRWCSEGLRPRLPWGRKLFALIENPSALFPVLEALKDDEQLYVRRSVANHLNDIAKDHAEEVVACCQRWREDSNEKRDWVMGHALRSLVKAGHAGALAVVGFGPVQGVQVALSVSPSSIVLGESVDLQVLLSSSVDFAQALLVDYVVHYVRQGGKLGEKVFKWKKCTLQGGEECVLHKKHAMRVTTVRALYEGVHRVEVQINGERLAEASFTLKLS